MLKEISFRPMQLSDVEEVHAMEVSIFPSPWSVESFRFEVQKDQYSKPWVAYYRDGQGDHIIGYIVPWIIVDEIHIANIAVQADFRERGIGKQLLLGAINRARKNGASSASLEVRSSNVPAQKLYQSFGFEIVGLRKRYYRDNREDAIIMRLETLKNIFLQSLMEAQ